MTWLRERARVRHLILLTMAGYFCLSAVSQDHYTHIQLCDQPVNLQGAIHKQFALEAELIVAIPHGIALSDKKCLAKGIQVDFPPAEVQDPSIKRLNAVIFKISRGHGVFYGEIRRNGRNRRKVYFYLQRVECLSQPLPKSNQEELEEAWKPVKDWN